MPNTLPLFGVLLGLGALSGCSDGPCSEVDGPVLFAWDNSVDHRLEGTNPLAYDTIGEALEAASPGTTVCISSGIWQEEISITKPDIHLRGAGSERTIIEPRYPFSDPRDSQATVIKVNAEGVSIEGVQLRGADTGLRLKPGSTTQLRDVDLRTNTVGLHATFIGSLIAEELSLVRNTEIGGLIQGESGDLSPLLLTDLRVEGNGQRGVSSVGGIRSSHPLVLTRAHFQDNTGTDAGDLHTRDLDAIDLHVGQPFSTGSSPRIVLRGETLIQEAVIHLFGGGIQVDCEGERISMVNTAVSDGDTSFSSEPLLSLEDCQGDLQHLTLAKLVGDQRGTGLKLRGESELTVENSALVHFDEAIAWDLREPLRYNNFEGSLQEAALLSPLGAQPNLRPQRDSPLIDGAEDLGLQRDVEGWNRPLGSAPDVGAYERR